MYNNLYMRIIKFIMEVLDWILIFWNNGWALFVHILVFVTDLFTSIQKIISENYWHNNSEDGTLALQKVSYNINKFVYQNWTNLSFCFILQKCKTQKVGVTIIVKDLTSSLNLDTSKISLSQA